MLHCKKRYLNEIEIKILKILKWILIKIPIFKIKGLEL